MFVSFQEFIGKNKELFSMKPGQIQQERGIYLTQEICHTTAGSDTSSSVTLIYLAFFYFKCSLIPLVHSVCYGGLGLPNLNLNFTWMRLLVSGECGAVNTPAFNAECSKLVHLIAHMSELCRHWKLPIPKELHRPTHFQAMKPLFESKLQYCGRFRVRV